MRNIFIVNATQVVVSDSHPEGLFSVLPDYPKRFDSRNYNPTEANPNGDSDKALAMAKSEFHFRLSALEASDTRAMWCITLDRADGVQIIKEKFGAFPDMTPPAPEPEPEPVVEP